MIMLTTGEKIRKFRIENNIKQHELCGKIITRNMLSMIENNKASINIKTLEKLIIHIENFCLEKKINCTLTLEDLLLSPSEQLKSFIPIFLEKLNNKNIDHIKENDEIQNIFMLLNQYDLKYEKAILNYTIATILQKNKLFYNAYDYYSKTLEYSYILVDKNKKYLYLTYIRAMYCCSHLGLFQDIIYLYKLSNYYFSIPVDDYNYSLTFNALSAYKKLNNLNKCFELIIKLESEYSSYLEENLNKKVSLLTIKANVLKLFGNYKESIYIYNQLLTLTKTNYEFHLITLLNLIELFRLQNSTRNVANYLNIALNIFDNYQHIEQKKYLVRILYNIGVNEYYLKNYDLCKYYYLKTLAAMSNCKEVLDLTEVFMSIWDYIYISKDEEVLSALKNTLTNNEIKKLFLQTSIPFKIIQFFNLKRDTKAIDDFLTLIIST